MIDRAEIVQSIETAAKLHAGRKTLRVGNVQYRTSDKALAQYCTLPGL
jgi:hypothetical protein